MKKKVFSLMMTLLLAFIGVAKAEVVTIGEGTTTYYYYPVNMYFNYSLTEQLYTPDEIGTAGTINAISFYYAYSSPFSMDNVTLYMKNVEREAFASNTDMEPLSLSDIVWTGTFSASGEGWVTITLDTPFAYDGVSNLLVAGFDGTSGYPGSAYKFRTTPCTGYKGIHWYSDSYCPDPYNTAGGFSGSKSYTQYRSNIQLDITAGGGAGVTQVVTIGEGTSTYYYYPVNMYFNYSLTEQLYTPDEIGVAGTISSIAFYYDYSSPFSMNNVTLYMKNVSREAFASNTDMEPLALGDIVWTGTFAATEAGWVTIDLDTPFAYDGVSNLLVAGFDGTSGYPGSAYKFRTSTCTGYKGIHWYSDSYCPDPYNTGSGFSGSKSYTQYRNNIQLTITTAGGGGGGVPDELHVAYLDGEEYVVDELNLGTRPNGAWMEPFSFKMFHDFNRAVEVTDVDFTPQGIFTMTGEEVPFTIARNDTVDLMLNVDELGETGLIEVQMVAIYGTGRTAAVWPVTVELYNPETPDVWELAYDFGTVVDGFSYEGIPSQITPTVLHNDYTLPFPEIPEGNDAVYKFTVETDMIIDAYVDPAANDGKVALYTEDFYGEGGPMATNNYGGLNGGGSGGSGSSGAPFEIQIGAGTSTTGYLPMYYLYNYSLSTQLYLGTELAAAGATTAPMNSISWYSESTYGYNIQNISIWMANVTDTQVSSTSPLGSGMSLVYQGNFQEVVGWNEFVFNAGNFAWDGTSNVLVMVQMNNGSWSSSISWQCDNAGFTAGAYVYQDNTPYSAGTTTYTLSTTTNRANTKFKSLGRERAGRELVTIAPGGTQQVAYPVNFIWAYTENQMILTSGEIGMSGYINSVAYKRASEGSGNPETRNIDIYMKHTTMDAYASTADWIPVTAADRVFSGNYTFQTVGEDWQTITLQTPFAYNGTDNLLICIDDNTGTTTTRQYWSCHTTPVARGMRAWGSSDFDPTQAGTPVGGSSLTGTFVADIQLDITQGGGGGGFEPGFAMGSAGPVIEDLAIAPGTYYLAASSTDADYTVYINMENMPCPAIDAEGFAFNPQPADNEDEVEPGSVTLRWMTPAYATGWRLRFGTTYHPEPNHPQTIMFPEDGSFTDHEMASSFTVRNLYNNTNYFWYVEFNNDACPEGVSSPVWGFTTHLNVPQNLYAEDETVFNDEPIVLHWTPVVDRTYRMYNVYQDGVLIGHTTMNNINNSTYTVDPLPYNMAGYVFYVTAVYDEGESAPSNEVTVKVSGRGNVDGHVYEQDGETGVAGATVTMTGQDEFGVNHNYNFQTNAQGYYSGAVYAGTYNGQAACDGYQTITEPIQGNPIAITYNQTTSPIDYMLDENFEPVCSVIAEYYPDSLDPHSPYVKVYWGCGLPGEEIIEPFETGDFSLFDWQIDPTYPWSITTYQPYEGTYCMKSGGAGVPNVISNMTVTVNIPADGIMSYFGKISCESSWDYGYFYIDGVQKAQYTGVSNWAEKSFDITAGDHTFQWQYTKDGSVDSNDDCFYVDYITFFKRPEPPQPAQPGWHTYAEGDFNNAVGSNVGTSRWAYEYPVSVIGAYAGFRMTKVSLFSDNMYSAVGGNYTCTIYQGGNEPMEGTPVSTITVDVPANMNAWVDFDLTTPVNVTGSDKLWVVWTANSTVSSWPAGCCDGLVEYGTWWSAGLEAGYGWEHETYGTWTMRQYFTNRGGEGFYSYASENAPAKVNVPTVMKGMPVMPEKGKEMVTATCVNPNAEPGASTTMGNSRAFAYYRIYRTDCYNEGPYTTENTLLLASEVTDTVYIDVDWPDAAPGIYKWGVGCVYTGNRGEEYESPITWTTPVANNTREELTYNFDDGMQNWTTIDADGDGLTWVSSMTPGVYHNSGVDLTGTGHNSSAHYVISGSYANGTGQVLYPDNYLVSPQIALGGSITFYACAQDASYAAEHFGVAVSTTGNSSASSFTTLQEWTLTAKGGGSNVRTVGRDGNNRVQGNWYQFTVDLSSYSGNGYVAIRHFNCSDEFILNVDDITINTSGGGGGGGGQGGGTASGSQLIDFEAGALEAYGFNNNASAYPWVIWNSNPYEGSYCMASGNYNVASSESSIEITVDFVTDGTIEFYSRISCESSYDNGYFDIDGGQQLSQTGNGSWGSHLYNVSAGTHTFRWRYSKDSSVNSNDDRYFIDNITFTGVAAGSGLQEPRESEIVWSNCLEKDMYLGEGEVEVTVLLNSADSPEGVTVSFENYSEFEQELYPVAPVVLDETGYYAWDSFRKGEYKVTVEFDGYYTIIDSVSIWDPTSLRYVMIEIIYGVSDLYVSRTGWAMWEGHGSAGGGGGGGQGGSGGTFSLDFENGLPSDWTVVDANNDGYTWCLTSAIPTTWTYYSSLTLDWYHNGSNAICSGSYINGVGALNPDEYLISPAVNLGSGSQLSFWVAATDASYPADHFGVFVSTTGTNPSDFTSVQEWTLTAKSEGKAGDVRASRDGDGLRLGNWYNYTVDLSAYAGSNRYIAFRHFNCYDQYIMCLDDVELTNGAKDERHLEYYKVMCESIDHEPIYNANTIHPFCQVATDQLVEGEHYICKVAAMYSTGMSDWIEAEWEYEPCDHWTPIEGLEITPQNEGNHLTWEFEGGGGGGGQGGNGDTFSVNFDDSQIPAGWTTIDGGSPAGYGWQIGSTKLGSTGNGHNGSADLVLSQSYDNNYGVVYPDNWLISPAVTLGSTSQFSLWACGQDANYAGEHFGVFVSTTGTNPSDFTMVQEWTLTAKGERYGGARGTRDQGTWYQKTVDLGSYAGAGRYIAIRHFNCSDMFYLDVDDIELTNGAKSTRDEVFFNGFVTDPGAMANGADASWIKGSQSTWGPNVNFGGGYLLGDVFTLSAATTISEIEVYGYQTGSTTTSTFTGLYAQIFNGNPMSGGTAIWGDANANIMTATAFTNCYRGSDGETTATTRPIMSITASNLNISLEAGTYYLVYSLAGTLSSGPWGAPHCEPNIGNTGNGVQYTTTGWQTLVDSGAGTTYGCAMKLSGNGGGGVPPTPVEGVLGFMVFRDGEWLAEILDPNAREYTDGDEFDEHEYCVRVIYDGTAVLPSNNYYYAMSCPVCEGGGGGQVTCDAGADIGVRYEGLTDEVTVYWGEQIVPLEEWLYYDDGNNVDAIGLQGGGSFYWGIMIPASSLAPYAGTSLTKVAYFDYTAHTGTIRIYQGGATAPTTQVYTQSYTANGTADWVEWNLTTPVALDVTQNLWIVLNNNDGEYVAACSNDTGDANGRWISLDGTAWEDVASYGLNNTWNLRGFVTNMAKGGEAKVIEFVPQGTANAELGHSGIAKGGSFTATRDRAEIVKYNVYRSTDNETYEQVGEVAAVAGQTYYEYTEAPATGHYYYQVRAYYDNGCESEPALRIDAHQYNYVEVQVTGVIENNGLAIYPNPTSGNVTIEANGMQHITVVSTLGQVVFDADVDTDHYILNMSQYVAGMYMVRVTTENGVSVNRVTVVR